MKIRHFQLATLAAAIAFSGIAAADITVYNTKKPPKRLLKHLPKKPALKSR